MFHRISLLIYLVVACHTGAYATNFSFQEALSLAKQGNADAQNAVGLAYFRGTQGVNKYADAFSWFEKAASQHQSAAMLNLGLMYQKGLGTLPDKVKGRYWIEQSAKAGNPDGLYTLGTLYQAEGNFPQAVYYVRLAAEKNHVEAFNRLAYFYSEGLGIPKDHAEAQKYYIKAGNAGLVKAQYNIALNYARGEGVPQDQALALEWAMKAANQHFPEAEDMVGHILAVQGKEREGLAWIKKAAAHGNKDAKDTLSNLYEAKSPLLGIPEDPQASLQWYLAEGKAGNRDAQLYLARFYGLSNHDKEGREWLEKSAAQEQPYARAILSNFPSDKTKAYVDRYNQAVWENNQKKQWRKDNSYQNLGTQEKVDPDW